MAFTEDLAVFINPDTPGYKLATIGGVPDIGCLFDNGFAAGLGMAGSDPSASLPSSLAASAAQGDAITVGGLSYTIAGIEPDGTGLTVFRLQES